MTNKADGKWKEGHSRGLDYVPARSFSEIAAELGISRQRAQQAFTSGLSKIVRGLNARDINPATIRELLSPEPRQEMEPDAAAKRVQGF